jgi:DNA mismatch repair protein MutL
LLNLKTELQKLGLIIEPYTNTSISVRATPLALGNCDAKKLLQDIIDDLREYGENVFLKELISHVLATYACHYSIRAGREMNHMEMNNLLREMEHTPHSGQCNHGRPTYIELELKDIEKLFGRS